MSLRDEILELDDLKRETITVPEWGKKKITIRELTGEERAELYEACTVGGKFSAVLMPTTLVALSVIDPETGKRVFALADRDKIKGKSGKAIQRLSEHAMKLSSLGAESQEEAEKN